MDEYSTWCRHVHVIHTTLKTALQTLIDSHKDQISGEDAKNYLGALDAFVRFLVHHHANEDKFEFPVLQKHSFAIVDELERDHVKLHQHIEGLQKIAASGTLDQQATKALLVSMQDFLVPHLNKEEAQVTPESLKAKGVKTEEIKQIQNSITEANKTLDGAVVLPMLYYNLQQDHMDFWSEVMPAILRWVIFPMILAPKHKGFWKFTAHGVKASAK